MHARLYLRPFDMAKHYLQEYQEILSLVRLLENRCELAFDRATRANGCITGVRVSGTPHHDRIASAAVELADLESALQKEIVHLCEALKMRLYLINQLEDERSKAILTARYIDGMPIKEIAKAMGCEVRHMRELNRVALQEFTAVLEGTN